MKDSPGGRTPAHNFTFSTPLRVSPGFGRYVYPVVDPRVFLIYNWNGWRLVVPDGADARAIAALIRRRGPAGAGYVRSGDALVPHLDAGNRVRLAQLY